MENEKIDLTQLTVEEKIKITKRTTGKIIFNVNHIKASTSKTPTTIAEYDAIFGYGSVWKILEIKNEIYKLQEIGTPLQRCMTKKSFEVLLKSQQ